ncbi:MAG: TonB-dependent receptor [Hyphomonadaceae bacterium]
MLKQSLLAAAMLGFCAPAWAQDPEGAPEGLEDIVITAQREEETLQRAAVPVAVLQPELLRDAGVTRPSDLSHLAPAIQVAGLSGSYTAYYLRGVGNFTGNSLAEPAVTFNFDGVSIGRPSSSTGFFYDLERIEILKGPQGTLYGRNATGGAINVLPRRPELNALGGELIAEYGDYDSVRIDAAINLPIGQQAAVRAAATSVRHDAYLNDGMDAQDDIGGRLSFLLEPSSAISLSIVGDYFNQGGRGPGATPIALGPDNRVGLSSAEGGAFYASQPVTIAGRNFNPIPNNQRLDNEFWGVNATVDIETSLGTLTLIPAYREGHLDTIGTATGMTLTIVEDDRQASFESRLVSDADRRLRYLLGAIVYQETNDVPRFVVNSQYNMSIQEPHTRTESAAVYGRLTYDLTDDFRLSLGARYTEDEKSFSGSFRSFNRLCPPVPTASCPNAPRFPVDLLTPPLVIPPGSSTAIPVFNPADGTLTVGFAVIADERESFSHTTWRAGLEWDLAENSLLYASYETGYKSGGFFFSNDSQTFAPEFVDALTLGWKNRLFDNRVQLDVEAFHWRYEDQQVSHITLDSRGATNLRTANIGQATIQGIEIEAQWLAPTGALLSADVQYLDASYDDYRYVTPLSSGPPLTGCVFAAGAGGFQVDCSGQQAPYSPTWTANFSAEQSFALETGASIVANARAHYQSETLTGLDFTPHEYQPGYWWFDASLTYNAPDDSYSVSLFGRNLTDEAVVANTFQPPFSRFVVGSLRPPQIFGVRVGMRY